ncbi:hypothetical protein [Oculatella sp. LEGE 06141]
MLDRWGRGDGLIEGEKAIVPLLPVLRHFIDSHFIDDPRDLWL